MSEIFELSWSSAARRAVAKDLPEAVAAAVLELVLGPLRENPYRVGKPLREPFEGVWSARRATYRVLYRINEEERTVLIEAIKHRGDAYR
ncbi:type II toxin-antitoxin system RelE/ParE family toxin [Allokutzneria multivorans]|uniref:type II toxin-antitoxin system RelE family toxin n=1 Tax=Allokutzneria multivorans TaxID=1142134 RepID=UPI0031F183BD